jgi:hypothetical protein
VRRCASRVPPSYLIPDTTPTSRTSTVRRPAHHRPNRESRPPRQAINGHARPLASASGPAALGRRQQQPLAPQRSTARRSRTSESDGLREPGVAAPSRKGGQAATPRPVQHREGEARARERHGGRRREAPELQLQRAGVVKPQRATDATVNAEALRLAEEHGAAEAAKRTGVSAATIRSWRHRSGAAGPLAGMDSQTWQEQKAHGAREAWATAQEALAQVRSLLAAGKTADAQRAALTMAILTDKSGVLEEAARRQEERQLRLAEAQGQLSVAVIDAYLEAIGLQPARPPARRSRTCSARRAPASRCRRRPRLTRRGRTSGARSAPS